MQTFYKYANVDFLSNIDNLLAISYASNNHEVAFFNPKDNFT